MGLPRRLRRIEALSCWCLLAATAASAQVTTGVLYGRAMDDDAEPFVGVVVELTGIGAPRAAQTDAQGRYFLAHLDPGVYRLAARIDGETAAVADEVEIRLARSTRLDFQFLGSSQTGPPVTTLLDERLLTPGLTANRFELERIPTARDPWALLPQTPGVLLDRVDVGGSETGRQPVFVTPTARHEDNEYYLDGVPVGDPGVPGSSATLFDFDRLWQAEVRTGGHDVRKMTPGATLNLVTRRGGNELRGSARVLLTEGDPQPVEEAPPALDRILEWGFGLGGPIRRDRVWIWGSGSETTVDRLDDRGKTQSSRARFGGLRLDAMLSKNNTLTTSWRRQDLTRFDTPNLGELVQKETLEAMALEYVGAWSSLAPEVDYDLETTVDVFKLEDTHLFGDRALLTASWSGVEHRLRGDSLQESGAETSEPLLVAQELYRGVWTRNGYRYRSDRPSREARLEGGLFLRSPKMTHEIRAGGRRRSYDGDERVDYGGRQIIYYDLQIYGFEDEDEYGMILHRGRSHPIGIDYTSFWLQDTLTRGAWTLNAGLRWDLQEGVNKQEDLAAHPVFGQTLPAVTIPAVNTGLDWRSLTPRLGLTRAFGVDRTSLVRASWARFVSLMTGEEVLRSRPGEWPYWSTWAVCWFRDGNGNARWDGQEVDGYLSCFDPTSEPLFDYKENDPDLEPETTDELVLALERSFRPEFAAGIGVTWRRTTGTFEERDLVWDYSIMETRLATREDYPPSYTQEGTLPDGRPYSVTVYNLDWWQLWYEHPWVTNGTRRREYLGIDLTATKRLSDGWMLRGYLRWGETTWNVPESFLRNDSPTSEADKGDVHGELHYEDGRRSDVKLAATWSANVNGLVQIGREKPWGFNLSGNLSARQGYPMPYWGISWPLRVSVTEHPDDDRLPDLYLLDLRLDKDFALPGHAALTASLEIFNVFDERTVLERKLVVDSPSAGSPTDRLASRTLRIGLGFRWR